MSLNNFFLQNIQKGKFITFTTPLRHCPFKTKKTMYPCNCLVLEILSCSYVNMNYAFHILTLLVPKSTLKKNRKLMETLQETGPQKE